MSEGIQFLVVVNVSLCAMLWMTLRAMGGGGRGED